MVSAYSTAVKNNETAFSISPRLLELRKKIHDEEYINNAVQRIAQVMSKRLMENREDFKE